MKLLLHNKVNKLLEFLAQSCSQNDIKDLGIISSDCFSRLPVDLKSAVCKLAQNRGQIFGVLEGALDAHEIRFAKTQIL